MASLSYDYQRVQTDAWLEANENKEPCPICHQAVYQGNWRKHMALKHSDVTDPLTYDEARSLSTHEAVITAGLDMFYAVGKALATIHEQRLYRATHSSFKAYCADRWNMSRQRGYQLMKAAGVVDLVSTVVDTEPTQITQTLITSEATAREIGRQNEDVQKLIGMTMDAVSNNLNIPKTPALAKSMGEAISTIILTKTTENGDGEQIEVSQVFEAQVVAGVSESIKRNQQYIHDGGKKKAKRIAAKVEALSTTPTYLFETERTASGLFYVTVRYGMFATAQEANAALMALQSTIEKTQKKAKAS